MHHSTHCMVTLSRLSFRLSSPSIQYSVTVSCVFLSVYPFFHKAHSFVTLFQDPFKTIRLSIRPFIQRFVVWPEISNIPCLTVSPIVFGWEWVGLSIDILVTIVYQAVGRSVVPFISSFQKYVLDFSCASVLPCNSNCDYFCLFVRPSVLPFVQSGKQYLIWSNRRKCNVCFCLSVRLSIFDSSVY